MDMGVKVCYMIWGSQCKRNIDRKIRPAVIGDIYNELTKASDLFAYLKKCNVGPNAVEEMLTDE